MATRLTTMILRVLTAAAILGLLTQASAKDLQIFTEENKPLNFTEGG